MSEPSTAALVNMPARSPRVRRERRAYARPNVDLRVTVVSDAFPHFCRAVNASREGMVVELTSALAAQDPHFVYRYELEIEGHPRMGILGRTAWRRGRLQGVRFVVMGELDRIAFDAYLHEIARSGASDADRLTLAEDLDCLRALRRAASVRVI